MNKYKSIILILCCLIGLIINRHASSIPYKPVNNITIKNFGKVDNCYYRSGQPKDSEFKQIAALGVRTIINLRHPFNFNKGGMLRQKAIANSLGINYINIPMIPTNPPSTEQINYYFSILNNSNNLPVLVYDKEGKDREGLMVALYRVKCYHWTYDQAYIEMRSYGYHRVLYPRLKHFLHDYTESLRTRNNLTQY